MTHEHGHQTTTHEHVGHGHDHGDHAHGHGDHAHGTGLLAKVRHGLSEMFGMHSHDHADSADEALEGSARGMVALKVSFTALMVTAFAQLAIVYFTGSVALLADTIHNFSDALTAIPLYLAFVIGRRAATDRYLYGYKRAEDLAGLFIVLMILLSAIIAGWESFRRLLDPQPIEHIGILFGAGVIGFLGNELVALYRIRIGKEIGSAALVADGHHARTDGLTSLAVALGAVGVWLGFEQADPIIGILISIAIFGVLRTAARDIFRRLMDGVDPEVRTQVEALALQVADVERVSSCRVRWLGHRMRAEVSVQVDGRMTVEQGHAVGDAVKQRLIEGVQHLTEVAVHIDTATTHASPAPVG